MQEYWLLVLLGNSECCVIYMRVQQKVQVGICTQSDQGLPWALSICSHIPRNQPLPYIQGLLFMDFDNVTLTSQKRCQHNNKFDCS